MNKNYFNLLIIISSICLCSTAISQGVSPDQNLVKMANQGDFKAQYELGNAYSKIGDYSKAYFWLLKSAEGGYPSAQVAIGVIYSPYLSTATDVAVTKNIGLSNMWLKKAVEKGSKDAIRFLAINYWNSAQDSESTIYWLTKSAEQGDKSDQAKLGQIYLDGVITPKDYKKAFNWYSKAVDGGGWSAETKLADLYFNGLGVEKNYTNAFYWYSKAAQSGSPYAQLSLAKMYQYGYGVVKDNVRAYAWYNILSANKTFEVQSLAAKNARSKLEMQMTNDEISEAQTLSSDWKVGRPLK